MHRKIRSPAGHCLRRPVAFGYSMTMRSSREGTGLAGDAAAASVRGGQLAVWSGVAGHPAMAGLEHALD
ncbi:hypothetical protein LH447_09655 [Laribacter hongkongensis]|nr:hypothetical protein [Laribacter hongkongensis]